jgi:hypothetical protein
LIILFSIINFLLIQSTVLFPVYWSSISSLSFTFSTQCSLSIQTLITSIAFSISGRTSRRTSATSVQCLSQAFSASYRKSFLKHLLVLRNWYYQIVAPDSAFLNSQWDKILLFALNRSPQLSHWRAIAGRTRLYFHSFHLRHPV